nr:LLM class flavin-dependent oxidoreductase [Streptomyces mexicanus]
MVVSLGIPWQGPKFATEATSTGVEAFCTGDFVDHEAYVSLAEMALSTSDARIGTAIAYAFSRSPFAHAAAIRQLHKRAGDRIFIGLGTGAYSINRDWFGVEADRPATRLGECIDVIRAYLTAENGETVSYSGTFYDVNARIGAPVLGRVDVPFLVGAFNGGMLRMAGRKADGVVGHGLFTRRWWNDVVRSEFATAAQKAGRSQEMLEYGWVVTAVDDDDPDRAALDARRMIAFYLTVATYDPFVDAHGWQEETSRIRAAFKQRDSDAMATAVSDRMLDEIAVYGTTEQARQMWAAKGPDGLPKDVAFLAPPSYLVSDRRKQEYARAAMRALGQE